MWTFNEIQGKIFFSVQWEIWSEINCGTTNFCVQQINFRALSKVKLKQVSGEPLSCAGRYRSIRV